MKKPLLVLFSVLFPALSALAEPPATFTEAKVIAKQQVYMDQATSDLGELYCGCQWKWVGTSGGRIDAASCGLKAREQAHRAQRTEWEHIVPAWTFGNQRQCWQHGGRAHCVSDDPVFQAMEADLFNLYPSVGEVNGDRSNYNYGMVSGVAPEYGQCRTKVDFKARVAEPRDEVKGLVARITFYMFDRYGLNMSRQQQQLLMGWNKQFPVTPWEQERDRRIAAVMGHPNPFVTGQRAWTLGYTPTGDGLVSPIPANTPKAPPSSPSTSTGTSTSVLTTPIVANTRSHLYHLPAGCPSYDKVAPGNRVTFVTESQAVAAGYHKAGNCR
jgi:deoxyribonuclease-1